MSDRTWWKSVLPFRVSNSKHTLDRTRILADRKPCKRGPDCLLLLEQGTNKGPTFLRRFDAVYKLSLIRNILILESADGVVRVGGLAKVRSQKRSFLVKQSPHSPTFVCVHPFGGLCQGHPSPTLSYTPLRIPPLDGTLDSEH
eukprot:1182258-Prorocentrum_minimum.AAC.2